MFSDVVPFMGRPNTVPLAIEKETLLSEIKVLSKEIQEMEQRLAGSRARGPNVVEKLVVYDIVLVSLTLFSDYLTSESDLRFFDSLHKLNESPSLPSEFDLDSFSGPPFLVLHRKLTVGVGITGVTFLDYKNKLFMQKDVRMRKYEMSGKSHGIWFILLFTTVEATLQIQSMELRLQRHIYNILQEFVDQYVYVVSTTHDLVFVR